MNPLLHQANTHPMYNIVTPGENDALCGRGGHTIHWSGNIKFRALVEKHRSRYLAASRLDKGKVVSHVVQLWRGMTPPGRFLTLTDPKLGESSPWHDIGDKKAQKKTAKRLREGHPETSRSSSDSESIDEEVPVPKLETSQVVRKSHIRTVSSESFSVGKSPKRLRREAADYEFVLVLNSLFDDQFQLGKELEQESLLDNSPISPERLLKEVEQELDALFKEPQELKREQKGLSFASFESSSSFTPPAVNEKDHVEQYLDQIAVSIPSAASLIELVRFD